MASIGLVSGLLARRAGALALVALGAAGCGPASLPPSDAAADAAPPSAAARALAPCRAARARPEDVATITGVVRHINALPQPATVACLIASLPRPLSVVATDSVISAQPAGGGQSPRLFLVSPTLAISVVAEGPGAQLVEFGEWVDARRTIKGELELPPAQPFAPSAAFERVRYGLNSGTTCAFCHREESPAAGLDGVYASVAFRPRDFTLVPLDRVRALAAMACGGSSDALPRCLFWRALFDYGEVQAGAFDRSVEVIFP